VKQGFKERLWKQRFKELQRNKTLKNKDKEKKQSKMKRIVEKRSNEGCASPPERPTHLAPTFCCLSILCLFCITSHPQLASVRFSNNQDQEKAHSNKETREKLAPTVQDFDKTFH
jgi:hypothetical protein